MGLTTGCWSLGLVVGPACGGLLASPAQLYPKYFVGTIFETFPYLLPNLVTASFALLGGILLFFCFPETLHLDTDSTTDAEDSSNVSSTSNPPNRGASIVELAHYPGVKSTLCAYLVISFSSICFDEVVPLWSMASHSHGGLQLPQVMIGTMLTITGVILTIYTLVIYPVIAQSLGQNLSFKVSQVSLAILSLVTTFLHSLPSSSTARFPLLVTFYTLSKASASLGFASIAIVLNHCVTKDKRGSLNGLSMTFGSIAKSFGPLFAAMTFAWSINRIRPFPLDYRLVFLVISFSCVISVLIPLPENQTKDSRGTNSLDVSTRDPVSDDAYLDDDEEHGLLEMKQISTEPNSLRGLIDKYLPANGQHHSGGYRSIASQDAEEEGEGA